MRKEPNGTPGEKPGGLDFAGAPELNKTTAGQIPVDMIGLVLVMRQSPIDD